MNVSKLAVELKKKAKESGRKLPLDHLRFKTVWQSYGRSSRRKKSWLIKKSQYQEAARNYNRAAIKFDMALEIKQGIYEYFTLHG